MKMGKMCVRCPLSLILGRLRVPHLIDFVYFARLTKEGKSRQGSGIKVLPNVCAGITVVIATRD